MLFPLLSAVQPHVRPSVSQSLAKDTSIASQTSTRDGEHSQHWSDMEGFDFICDYWYPGKLKVFCLLFLLVVRNIVAATSQYSSAYSTVIHCEVSS